MSPILLFPIAIITPVLLTVLVVGPIYGALFGASYLIYAHADANQLPAIVSKWMDGFYILDVYSHLFTYWRAHMETADLLHYTLPLLALPVAGVCVAQWLVRRFLNRLANLFHMAGAH